MVCSGAASPAIHSRPESPRQRVCNLRQQPDAQRRQRRAALRRQHALGADSRPTISSTTISQNNPYPIAQGGANVPGFNAINLGGAQLFNLGNTKTLSPTAVNEFRFSFLRAFQRPRPSARRTRRQPRIAGIPVPAPRRHRAPRAANRRSREHSLQQLLHRHQHQRTQASATIPTSGSTIFPRLRDATPSSSAASFITTRSTRIRSPSSTAVSCSSAARPDLDFADFLLGAPTQYNQSQLQSFLRTQQISRPLRPGQLAPSAQSHAQLWPALGPHRALVRKIQSSRNTRARQTICSFSHSPRRNPFPYRSHGSRETSSPHLGASGQQRFRAPRRPRLLAQRRLRFSSRQDSRRSGPNQPARRFRHVYTAIEALTIGVLAANAPYGTTYTSPTPPLFASPSFCFNRASAASTSRCNWPRSTPPAAIPTPTSTGRSTSPSAASRPIPPPTAFLTPRNTCSPSSASSRRNTVFSASYVGASVIACSCWSNQSRQSRPVLHS